MSQENGIKTVRKKKKSHKGSFVFGVIIIVFALIGAGYLISLAVGAVSSVFNSDRQKKAYEEYLYPVVMLDPENFDDITKADMNSLLNAAILSLLTKEDASPYDYEFVEGENSGYAVDEKTVEEAFTSLFGTEVKPVHQNVECSTCVFEYQSVAHRYIIPLTGYDPAYTPKVYKMEKKGEGIVELTVGYIAYSDWATDENTDFTQPEPAKYRKIVLRNSDSGQYISAIKNADASEFTVRAEQKTQAKTVSVQTTSAAVTDVASAAETTVQETSAPDVTAANTETTSSKK